MKIKMVLKKAVQTVVKASLKAVNKYGKKVNSHE